MRTTCPECDEDYDDATQWAACPHAEIPQIGDDLGTLGKVIVVVCIAAMLALAVIEWLKP